MKNRTNDEWIDQLLGKPQERDIALDDLRNILSKGIRASLENQPAFTSAMLDDIVQDTLLTVLKKLGQFQNRSRFTTWCMTIGIRLAITELRRLKWKDVSLEQLTGEKNTQAEVPDNQQEQPDSSSEKQDLIDLVNRLIEQSLTEKQKMVLKAELSGMPQEEIARRINSNRNAIYKLVHDARKKLKRALEEAGYPAHEVLSIL